VRLALTNEIMTEEFEATIKKLERLDGLGLPGPVANGYLHGRKGVEFVV